MRLTRIIHLEARFKFGKLEELAPDFYAGYARAFAAGAPDAIDPDTIEGLGFIDSDGEVHLYLLGRGQKDQIVEKMTGGVLISSEMPPGS